MKKLIIAAIFVGAMTLGCATQQPEVKPDAIFNYGAVMGAVAIQEIEAEIRAQREAGETVEITPEQAKRMVIERARQKAAGNDGGAK